MYRGKANNCHLGAATNNAENEDPYPEFEVENANPDHHKC